MAAFFAGFFTAVFAAGLRVAFATVFLMFLFASGGGLETCFTARFAALPTAATAPFTELFTDLTAS
ncbi:MAG: hypothetical protein ABI886_06690, partial [Betaproteobacteria bacterium]